MPMYNWLIVQWIVLTWRNHFKAETFIIIITITFALNFNSDEDKQ